MKTKLLYFGLLLICLVGSQSIMFAQTIYVNSTTGSDATGNGTSSNPYKTFNKGYTMASSGGTLDLTGTFTWTDSGETANGYTISKNITIQGQGANQTIIQAATSSVGNPNGVFTVTNSTNGGTSLNVTIKNLEIRYGYLSGSSSGGGIAITWATVTISNCYIDHNQAGQGSAISALYSNLIINNSTISNNVALGIGGGALYLNTSSDHPFGITITNSTVCNNSGGNWGGGIATAYGVHYVTNCTIAYNSCTISSNGGGGISVGGNNPSPLGIMYIKNSIVANNTNSTTADDYDDIYGGSTINNGSNIIGISDSPTLPTTNNKSSLYLSSTLAPNGTIIGVPTLALSTGSVAINNGSYVANGSVAIPTTDQRGLNRVGQPDIGAYEYGAAALIPTIVGISPTNGLTSGGTSVILTGINFTGTSAVKFGATNATSYTVNSDTQITATSPAGSGGTVDITVTTPGGTSATSSSDQYTYIAPPTITGISPISGPITGGTTVIITGTNLTTATAVKFGATNAASYTVNSATQVTATSPAGSAGTIHLAVTTAGGTSATGSSDQFTYFATPTITGISPTSGLTAGGTSIVVTGTNLTGATAVKFGAANAASYTVNSAIQITATSPAGSVGLVDITVTTPGGTSATGASDQFTYLTSGTFTGATNNDWATISNWAGGSIPISTTDVTIPSGQNVVISATTTANCNNLTVTGSLTIQSTSSGTGSLIVSGTSTGSVICQRYTTGNIWHMVSPVAAGGSLSTFIQSAGNAIALTGSNYGMMDYNETSNLWNSYFTSSVSGNFTAGKGYGLRRSSDGVVTFTGTLTSGTNTVAITKSGTTGWNLIGNPYTSSIYMNTAANSSYNFLRTNAIDASKLDASYACIYLWDVTTSKYKILGNTSYSGRDLDINVFAPGQAFFIKAATAGTVEFNKNMQVQQTGSIFKVPQLTNNWPGITLTATSTATSSSAIITFNENMTNGLDPSYDAGLLRGTNGLSIYTRLVEDNGVDFAIQCLPTNYNNLVIPIGVDCNDGGDVTFSAENVDLPSGYNIILEDKITGTFTSLTGNVVYKATLPAETSGIGRFYIHTGTNLTTGTSGLNVELNKLNAYIANGVIIIEGEVGDHAIATLFDLQGQKVNVTPLQKKSLNTLSCPNLIKGIYMLTIQQNGETVTRKLIKK